MSIFKRGSKKRQEKSVDSLNIIVKTQQKLSDEQIDTITTIVENGIIHDAASSDIAIQIMTNTGIFSMIIINRQKNGDVEVIL